MDIHNEPGPGSVVEGEHGGVYEYTWSWNRPGGANWQLAGVAPPLTWEQVWRQAGPLKARAVFFESGRPMPTDEDQSEPE